MSEKKGLFAALFGGGDSGGCCNVEIPAEAAGRKGGAADEKAVVKILGSGCHNCQALEKNVRSALEALGKEAVIGHVMDFGQISAYGVMSTPGLVVDEKVVSTGKVLSVEDAKRLLAGLL